MWLALVAATVACESYYIESYYGDCEPPFSFFWIRHWYVSVALSIVAILLHHVPVCSSVGKMASVGSFEFSLFVNIICTVMFGHLLLLRSIL